MRLFAPTLILAAALASGCASYHADAADAEQRTADDLRNAGAGSTTAARDAQTRANRHRQSAQCQDALECTLDVLGQVVLGLLGVKD